MKRMMYLQILEGEGALVARPVLTCSDVAVVAAVGKMIAERLGVELQRVIKPEPKPDNK